MWTLQKLVNRHRRDPADTLENKSQVSQGKTGRLCPVAGTLCRVWTRHHGDENCRKRHQKLHLVTPETSTAALRFKKLSVVSTAECEGGITWETIMVCPGNEETDILN